MASSQYSVTKHTIVPLILKITHQNTLSYLIRDPATSSLILLPSSLQISQRKFLKQHIKNIQNQFQCKLTHSFIRKNSLSYQIFDEKILTPQSQGQLKPQLIGDISICFINAFGYQTDYNLIAATHITPISTKFPVLFVGNALSVCSIDLQSKSDSRKYQETLNKLKYFPNQTLIFPEKQVNLDDLQFAYALDKNPFLAQKIEQFKQKYQKFPDCLIPTSILEQKMLNPFLNSGKYSSLLKSSDKISTFQLLRKTRAQWRK